MDDEPAAPCGTAAPDFLAYVPFQLSDEMCKPQIFSTLMATAARHLRPRSASQMRTFTAIRPRMATRRWRPERWLTQSLVCAHRTLPRGENLFCGWSGERRPVPRPPEQATSLWRRAPRTAAAPSCW